MSDPLTSFTKFQLNEQEQRLGQQLTSLNVAVIQNIRSGIAEEKIRLTFNPEKVLEFTQNEAYMRGQLDILSYILDCNEDSQQSHHITSGE